MSIAMHCNLKAARRRASHSWFLLWHQPTNSTIPQPARTYRAPVYQISAKSDNPRLSYCWANKSSWPIFRRRFCQR